jgi:hypothetical protein
MSTTEVTVNPIGIRRLINWELERARLLFAKADKLESEGAYYRKQARLAEKRAVELAKGTDYPLAQERRKRLGPYKNGQHKCPDRDQLHKIDENACAKE